MHPSLLFPASLADVPTDVQLQPIHQREYLLNGEMVAWAGKTQDVFSPVGTFDAATGTSIPGTFQRQLMGSFPVFGPAEAMAALDAAVAAYDNGRGEWPQMAVADRIACMETFVGKMLQQRSLVINLIMWEIGKNRPDATKEFDRTVKYIYDTINVLKDMDRASSRFRIEEGIIGQIRRSPLGVVLSMGPFNYPLNETYTTLIPAILMGNTILFKTPKHGSLLHYPLLEAFRSSFPKGVVNSLYGRGAEVIPPVMQSGKVNVLTLIGSSKVADQLQRHHPKLNRLRSILSLDAKNAAIVLPDADLDVAVSECLLGTLSFNGQRCTAIKIIWAHRSIVDQFLAKFGPAVSALKLGMPWADGAQITPLPEAGKTTYLTDLIRDAEAGGAAVVNAGGGEVTESLFRPAVVYPVREGMKLYREEQFGPVIPVVAYDDVEAFMDYLITDDHGMQASIFGTDPQAIADLIDPLVTLVSRVNINAQCQRGPDTFPFTGRKDTAAGTLSVEDALRSFSIRSAVATKDTGANKAILNDIVGKHESVFLSTNFIF
jgi:glyceraldehyde-3-phosphate dehydrogenase (NADP+)